MALLQPCLQVNCVTPEARGDAECCFHLNRFVSKHDEPTVRGGRRQQAWGCEERDKERDVGARGELRRKR
ncbi:hypothetical protein E2C01_059944 [Portunus trituberculatus]|uniref:Uncharacterized protein n=1 Tax=Portunus trituberculatus TaxID=210409 RepID=A0A5B7HA12_PORTR|nr:hypothetical protein [Portunus trituberculatus]